MDEYILMFRETFNFKGLATRREFWMATLFTFIYLLCINLTCSIAYTLWWVYYVCAILTVVPMLSLMIRRFNSAGISWKNIFWILLPIAGWIVLIVHFCRIEVHI
ncbi:MAG: DUF805 domain-containing protein [Clostridia bacterium]|nr:DUF805 domain-containing protein [Clostridia bacterium]